MRKASFKEFKINNSLYVFNLFGKYPVHWEWYDDLKEYVLVDERYNNLMYPPHAKTLKELYNLHRIMINEETLLI